MAGLKPSPTSPIFFGFNVRAKASTCHSGTCRAGGEVGGDVGEDVDADHVGETESAGARPANGLAGEGVGFFDGEALLQHQGSGGEHDGDADAVGDEVGRVVGEHDLLAEEAVAKSREGTEERGVGLRRGNDFKQLHVARRIEEVRPEELFPGLLGECGRDLGDRQAGGVGGEQRIGAEVRGNAGEQRVLDGQVFSDGFDDPVAGGELGEVVVEVAGGDAGGVGGIVEGGGF